jgi:hypothetical protein
LQHQQHQGVINIREDSKTNILPASGQCFDGADLHFDCRILCSSIFVNLSPSDIAGFIASFLLPLWLKNVTLKQGLIFPWTTQSANF